MSAYEAASLATAQYALWWQAASVLVAALALIVAAVGGWFIWLQLRASQWNTMLQFEMEMHRKSADLSDLAAEIPTGQPEALKLFEKRVNALEENYLNAVDRFCSSILHGQFPDKKLRPEYRGYIEDVLRKQEKKFGPGTRFRNVQKLHERWLK